MTLPQPSADMIARVSVWIDSGPGTFWGDDPQMLYREAYLDALGCLPVDDDDLTRFRIALSRVGYWDCIRARFYQHNGRGRTVVKHQHRQSFEYGARDNGF